MKTNQDTYKSMLVTTLSKIFPKDQTLLKYDMLRGRAKKPQLLDASEKKQLLELSQRLKRSLVLKYRELNCRIKNSERTHAGGKKGNFRNQVHSDSGPNNSKAVHMFNIIKRVLKHEWKLDTDAIL